MTERGLSEEERQRHNEYNRAYRAANYQRSLEQEQVRRKRLIAAGYEYPAASARPNASASARRWQMANRERYLMSRRARNVVRRALKRGVLSRPSICEGCGASSKPIQAAHFDYSRPLVVRWLCAACHIKWDHIEPKTRRAA